MLLVSNWPSLSIGLAVFCFYSKTGFWPSYCQPICIKFYTFLLLYGIHLWADLDRDLSPIQRRRISAMSAANHQNGGEDGCYREKFRNFIARAKKQHFFAFLRYPTTVLLKNAIRFDLRRKITKLSRENRLRKMASPGVCDFLGTPQF